MHLASMSRRRCLETGVQALRDAQMAQTPSSFEVAES
jgi:hypothetical protein